MSESAKKTKKKGPFAPWQRSSGPIWSICRILERVRIDFQYSPERVAALKALAGARYHPDDKSWSIPLASLPAFRELAGFSERSGLNGLGPLEVQLSSGAEALTEAHDDPFSVREEVLAALDVEVIIRANVEKRRVRVIPRVGSSAHRILKRFPSASYSSFDQSYVVPAEQIPNLLKKYRDKGISFAVERQAGMLLSGSAALRRAVLEHPERYSADDLSQACLVPFITRASSEDGLFRPCFFTAEQFKLAFPGHKRQTGRVFHLDESGVLQFFSRRDSLPFTVWMSAEVWSFVRDRQATLAAQLEEHSGPLSDEAAHVVVVPLLWRIEESGRGALVVNLSSADQVRDIIVSRLGEVVGSPYSAVGEALILEVPDSRLVQCVEELRHLCEVNGWPLIPESVSFSKLVKDVVTRNQARERCAYFAGLVDTVAGCVTGLDQESAARLFPHQRVAVEWLRDTPYAFLGDDMGLGKTLSVLSYYQTLRSSDHYDLLLVVCPNSLARNWQREASMWFPHLRTTIIAGDKASKAWTLRLLTSGSVEQDIVVVNYEAVRLDYVAPELHRLAAERKTLLCLDESQRVKNPSGKTYKAITGIAPACERRVLLSGTPTPKDISDLWAQMRILDGGKRFGKSYYKWLSQVAELGTEYSSYAVKKFREGEVEEAVLRAHELMLRRRKEKVVNLPPKIFSLREVTLTGSQRERYDEIREGLMLRMRALSGEQFVREITNILEEYLRAVQIASNPRLVDPLWQGEPAKFLELDEIVDEVVREHNQKLVVWTNYVGNVRELCERYKELGASPFFGEVDAAEREKTVRVFQESESPRILVAVPAAGGVGITLTAAQTAVYLDKTWNAEHWMQSVDRLHRIGQAGTVSIISLLGCKVDEVIHWNLRRKERNQSKVLGDFVEQDGAGGFGISRDELLEALEY